MAQGDLHYAHEKFDNGRRILASLNRSLTDRFLDALMEAFKCVPLEPGVGPAIDDDLADAIVQFHDRLTAVTGQGGMGSIEATVRSLSTSQLDRAIEDFLDLAVDIDRAYYADRDAP